MSKILKLICFSFLLCLMSIKITMAAVYRVDDLKESMFLENDSSLYLYTDYINEYGIYKDSVDIIFLPDVSDKENFEKYFVYKESNEDFIYGTKKISLNSDSSIKIKSYKDTFGVEVNDINGWLVKRIDAIGTKDSNIEIVLEPYNLEFKEPSNANAYTICKDCIGNGDYSWYKVQDVTESNLTQSFNTSNILNYSNNTWIFSNLDDFDKKEAYISFKFDANEGDIISFDSKINLGVEDKFWGNIFCEIDGERRNLDKSIFFINNKIQITDSGSHTLKFGITNYNDNYTDEIYAYFKNIRILTLITNSDALDETKLSGGEKILYEGITSTGNFVSNSMLYERSEYFLSQSLEVKNPETNSIKIFLLIVGFAFVLGMIVYTFRKYKWVK